MEIRASQLKDMRATHLTEMFAGVVVAGIVDATS
jgi:hypothetical protein